MFINILFRFKFNFKLKFENKKHFIMSNFDENKIKRSLRKEFIEIDINKDDALS